MKLSEEKPIFYVEALDSLYRELTLIGLNLSWMATPYFDGEYHCCALLLLPIGNLIKTCLHALNALGNFFAIFVTPLHQWPEAIASVFIEAGSAVLSAISLVFNVVSLITRTIATIFNLGYVHDLPEKENKDRPCAFAHFFKKPEDVKGQVHIAEMEEASIVHLSSYICA